MIKKIRCEIVKRKIGHRGRQIIKYYEEGWPHIYCIGYKNNELCRNCKLNTIQGEKDLQQYLKQKKKEHEHG